MRPIYEAKKRRPFLDKVASASARAESQLSPARKYFGLFSPNGLSASAGTFYAIMFTEEVARVLGVEPRPARSITHQGFFRMGMDSLMSVQLRQRLENSFDGCSLPLTLAFEYPNIEALTSIFGTAKSWIWIPPRAERQLPVDRRDDEVKAR